MFWSMKKGIYILIQPGNRIPVNKGALPVLYLLLPVTTKKSPSSPYLIWDMFFPFNFGIVLAFHCQEWTFCTALCPENNNLKEKKNMPCKISFNVPFKLSTGHFFSAKILWINLSIATTWFLKYYIAMYRSLSEFWTMSVLPNGLFLT